MNSKLSDLVANTRQTEAISKPVFFRLSDSSDKIRFKELLEQNTVDVYDQITSQVEEFIKITHPSKIFNRTELEHLTAVHLGNRPREEYGVWVFYPWCNKLVHLLDENEFVAVRTNRNQNKITKEEREILSKKRVGIIGLSVGQSIALTLAMERICGEIRIADFDVLDLSNLNRIRTGVHNIGIPKTVAVAREISELDPYLKVICFHEGITEKNLDTFLNDGEKLNILIDECDDLYIKIKCRQQAKLLGIAVIMDTSDRGMLDVERFDLEPGRPILHGLIDHLEIDKLKRAMTNEEKIPFVLSIIGINTISKRMKDSMAEIRKTITTWPQLASSVVIGGGAGADVCRRILLNEFHDSGRFFLDPEELIKNKI
ncbi:MAG: hypothetical protein JWO32_2950 [Bacteroidetes bacterium]|nr:hypothetical protein [Bacteroidota bacterium]